MVEEIKKKRGRPKGSTKKKPTPRVKKRINGAQAPEETNGYRYDPDYPYRYWFVASACGCRLGADLLGSGMFCKHKNIMLLETKKEK